MLHGLGGHDGRAPGESLNETETSIAYYAKHVHAVPGLCAGLASHRAIAVVEMTVRINTFATLVVRWW